MAGDHIKEDNKGQQSNTPNKMEEDRTQHGINGIEKENQTEAKLGKRHLFTLSLINFSIKLIGFPCPK